MSECPRLGRLIGGCAFEPRYDLSAAELPNREMTVRGGGVQAYFEACRTKTYVHDVCVRCGKVVKRDEGGADG